MKRTLVFSNVDIKYSVIVQHSKQKVKFRLHNFQKNILRNFKITLSRNILSLIFNCMYLVVCFSVDIREKMSRPI